MKVILLENVAKIGRKYQIKNIAAGYVRNFLMPKKLVIAATPATEKKYEVLRNQEAERHNAEIEIIKAALEKVNKGTFVMTSKVNEKGHLFAGIHKNEVVAELQKIIGIVIPTEMIECEDPIKTAGAHEVTIKLDEEQKKLTLKIEQAE